MVFLMLILVAAVWGNLYEYSNTYVNVDGTKYYFSANVIIDTYSLTKDPNGNVRVELDVDGKAKGVYFYGIDMPEAVGRYKRR